MAVKYAIISGSWSNPAIWNGGTKPQAGDVVHSNGYYVNMDEALITVDKVTNGADAGFGIVVGGYFQYSVAGTAVLNANMECHSGYCVLANNNGAITINGNSVTIGSGVYGLYINISGHPVTLNGDADSINSLGNAVAVWGSGGFTLNGNVYSSNISSGGYGLSVYSGGGNVVINGDVHAGLAAGAR